MKFMLFGLLFFANLGLTQVTQYKEMTAQGLKDFAPPEIHQIDLMEKVEFPQIIDIRLKRGVIIDIGACQGQSSCQVPIIAGFCVAEIISQIPRSGPYLNNVIDYDHPELSGEFLYSQGFLLQGQYVLQISKIFTETFDYNGEAFSSIGCHRAIIKNYVALDFQSPLKLRQNLEVDNHKYRALIADEFSFNGAVALDSMFDNFPTIARVATKRIQASQVPSLNAKEGEVTCQIEVIVKNMHQNLEFHYFDQSALSISVVKNATQEEVISAKGRLVKTTLFTTPQMSSEDYRCNLGDLALRDSLTQKRIQTLTLKTHDYGSP